MAKKAIGPQALLYPLPALLIGAKIGGKPNFMTAAWGGIACSDPPMVSVGIRPTRHTLKGLRENKTFSVNVPSTGLVRETDYCGLTSGSRVDKIAACGFEVFYGKLGSAPMVEQCPVNLECEVAQMIELGSHVLVLGRIVEVYASEACLADGKPDVARVDPLVYVGGHSPYYTNLGTQMRQKAFSVGAEIGKR